MKPTGTINAGNIGKIFRKLRKKIGKDSNPQYLLINNKRSINKELYRGKGRPRKSDYNHDSDYDYLIEFANKNGFQYADKSIKNGKL